MNEMEYNAEIIQEFLIETEELLEKLDADLVELEKRPDDLTLVNEVFRSAHTIKGTSGFLGFTEMSKLMHAAEDVLNRLRKGNLQLTSGIMDSILDCVDCLRRMLAAIREGGEEVSFASEQIAARLLAVAENADNRRTVDSPATGHRPPGRQPGIQHEGETDKGEPVPDGVSQQPPRVEAVAKETAAAADAGKSGDRPGADREAAAYQTVRVPVGRLDHLMNLTGELVLGRNRLNQIASFFEAAINISGRESRREETWGAEQPQTALWEQQVEMLSESNALIGLITAELQMAIMQTRMLPVDTLFKKVPRLVRDLSKEMGKQVNLVIEGKETEVDKSVIEELSDPMTHLIRNSLDHGLESAEERIAAGKPPTGTLRIFARQQGNHIHVGIQDDGAGIDPEKIKNRAVERGMISKADAERMNDREVVNLIFHPGFSTKKNVSQVSGRGVGMDVVKTNVSRLNGMIEVDSRKGEGTTFLLKLPLTLAIIQGLMVGVADEVYILPIASVLEAVRIGKGDIYKVDRQKVIRLRDTIVPLISLEAYFDIRRKTEPPAEGFAVIVAIADKRFALLVDDLLGQEEVVIKTLGDFFDGSRAVAGATIMGDGRVRLIVDVAEIARMGQEKVA